MPIKLLTVEQHQEVLSRLRDLARSVDESKAPDECPEYVSLMVCFLLHIMSAADSLLRLRDSCSNEWFPVSVGYIIARSMFEADITAHYISQAPKERAQQYILYERVLYKHAMEACNKHRTSNDTQWRESMNLVWNEHWLERESKINHDYNEVRHQYELKTKNGKVRPFHNWSGKSIKQMAKEVFHEEAYDRFYSELSSFTHADIHLANRFLHLRPDGMWWSQSASEFDVGNVFRYAATFLTCYLKLFGEKFDVWEASTVDDCWEFVL